MFPAQRSHTHWSKAGNESLPSHVTKKDLSRIDSGTIAILVIFITRRHSPIYTVGTLKNKELIFPGKFQPSSLATHKQWTINHAYKKTQIIRSSMFFKITSRPPVHYLLLTCLGYWRHELVADACLVENKSRCTRVAKVKNGGPVTVNESVQEQAAPGNG